MENKNTVIALVLMGVVWFGFSFLFAPEKSTEPASVPAPAPVVEQTHVAQQSLDDRCDQWRHYIPRRID